MQVTILRARGFGTPRPGALGPASRLRRRYPDFAPFRFPPIRFSVGTQLGKPEPPSIISSKSQPLDLFSLGGASSTEKVRTPLCLSWHPANPPTADEVVQKARPENYE